MIRFKVIKGSHLLLGLAAAILIAVILFILLSGGFRAQNAAADERANASAVSAIDTIEAKAISAFALNGMDAPPLQIRILPDAVSSEAPPELKGRILIYHTHTHEAYRQDEDDPYEAVEAWRTRDESHSVVRVGEALAQELRERGYDVIHDTSDHEQDSLSDSYVRSLATLESYAEEFDLCIDLHRDAYVDGAKLCLNANDEEYAQIMMLVGRGDNYDLDSKPDYENNFAFAQSLTLNLNRCIDGICRNVTVKSGRYNQHIGKQSVLIEVGHNLNSLQQALNSIPTLAEGICKTMKNFH